LETRERIARAYARHPARFAAFITSRAATVSSTPRRVASLARIPATIALDYGDYDRQRGCEVGAGYARAGGLIALAGRGTHRLQLLEKGMI